jgi:hypothetical protein
MSQWQVEKRSSRYVWATGAWAWKEWAKYFWTGNMLRSTVDYYDLWLNRDRYIEKHFTFEEIQQRTEAFEEND